MSLKSLSLTARTLYAEAVELALTLGYSRTVGNRPGGLVTKRLKGRDYLYYQYSDLRGRSRQVYLGADSEAMRQRVVRSQAEMEGMAQDLERLNELRAAFVAAGGFRMDPAPFRVIKGFADAGLLRPLPHAAVLIGTHAFHAIGNMLGVRWSQRMRTQDIDLAAEPGVDLAVTRAMKPVPDILAQLEMGFIPVPTLDPKAPSTSYRIRGKELRVDLLTPLLGKPDAKPVLIPALKAPALPVRFLDYLIEDPVPGLIFGRSDLVLANLPNPARFALHKLIVSESRPAAFAAKAQKDRLQAAMLLDAVLAETPDDLERAAGVLLERGPGWLTKVQRAMDKSRAYADDAFARLETLLDK